MKVVVKDPRPKILKVRVPRHRAQRIAPKVVAHVKIVDASYVHDDSSSSSIDLLHAATSASEWNSLVTTARAERGPQWDVSTQQFLVDKGSDLYYDPTPLLQHRVNQTETTESNNDTEVKRHAEPSSSRHPPDWDSRHPGSHPQMMAGHPHGNSHDNQSRHHSIQPPVSHPASAPGYPPFGGSPGMRPGMGPVGANMNTGGIPFPGGGGGVPPGQFYGNNHPPPNFNPGLPMGMGGGGMMNPAQMMNGIGTPNMASPELSRRRSMRGMDNMGMDIGDDSYSLR